jgi:SAM-dependent methyltransferase
MQTSVLPRTVHRVMPGRFVPALGLPWLTPIYDLLVGLGGWEQAFKARLIDQAAIQPTEAVLDLGCGTGTLALEVKRRLPLAKVVGLDADPTCSGVPGLRSAARAFRSISTRLSRGAYPTPMRHSMWSSLPCSSITSIHWVGPARSWRLPGCSNREAACMWPIGGRSGPC